MRKLSETALGTAKDAAAMMAFLILAAVMLSWVALYNQAPLVFSDTLTYAMSAYQREMPGFFSIFYSAYILPLHRGISFWPVVFVQGAMLAHVLFLTARCVSDHRVTMVELLAIVGALSVFSSLPWLTGQILPDVFTPVLLLGMFLLAFCSARLGRWELAYVWGLTTASITTHLSHVPIAIGLAAICMICQPLLGPKRSRLRNVSAMLVTSCAAAICMMLAANWVSSRQLVFARNSSAFLLAKWIDEGPALWYLTDACASERYALCAHLEQLKDLSHDELKWAESSPLKKVGSFDELEPEARRIVGATLRSYPLQIFGRAILDAGAQLLRVQAGDGLVPNFATFVGYHLGILFGADVGDVFIQSRQARGELPVTGARALHLVGLLFGIVSWVCAIVVLGSGLPKRQLALYAVVCVGILWNGMVTGALSGPHDRYLARVIWLLCFIGLLGASAHRVHLNWRPSLTGRSSLGNGP
jgi:hypothetical protein